MKRLIPFLFLLAQTVRLIAQDGSDILKAHWNAMGGQERWSKLKSLQMDATVSSEFEILQMQKWWIRGKSYRQNIRVGGRTVADSTQTYFVLVNGEKGWKKLPDQKGPLPIQLDSAERQWYLNDIEFLDPLLEDARGGKRITYLQTEYFNDKFHHKFQIRYDGSPKVEYAYLDPDDYTLVMSVAVDAESENTRTYSHYTQHPDGFRYPAEINTARGLMKIDKIVFNPTLKTELFVLPAQAPVKPNR